MIFVTIDFSYRLLNLMFIVCITILIVAFIIIVKLNKIRLNKEIIVKNELLDTISYSSDEIFVLFDKEKSKIIYISGNVKRIMGISQFDFMNLDKLKDLNERDLIADIKNINSINNYKYDFRIFNDDAKDFFNINLVRRVLYNDHYIVSIIRDDSLNKHHKEILFDALNKADDIYQSKLKFLSKVSHEIRTPLNGILGMNEIAREYVEYDKDKTFDALKKIESSGLYLLQIINNILDFSKIESGKMELSNEVFLISDLLNQIEGMLINQAHVKNIKLNIKGKNIDNLSVNGDKLKLMQILINLLSNSIKFSNINGEVSLIAQARELDFNKIMLKFKIIDDGIGMSDDFCAKLFTPFSQEERANVLKNKGTGLGLNITKNLVTLMNGDIYVKSKINEGTKFNVNIVFDKATLSKEKAVKENYYDKLKGMKVLLAEDNDINIEICLSHLSKYNMNIDITKNGQECLDKFNEMGEYYYDLILLDIQMPLLNGYEVASRIRSMSMEYAKKIKIIAMTADALDDDIKHAISIGMNSHISKPILKDELVERIEGVLRK